MTRLDEKEMQLVSLISEKCSTPGELTEKLKSLFGGALEKMLEAEMDEHLLRTVLPAAFSRSNRLKPSSAVSPGFRPFKG